MRLLRLVAAATSLGLAALGAILFLNADKTQASAVLPDNSGPLDTLVESAEQLLKAFAISKLNTHKCSSPPLARVYVEY
jgi:hypothetical protein